MMPLTAAAVETMTTTLSPAQTMALTAWAEARSRLEPGKGWVANPIDAMVDILNVIDNRAHDPRWQAKGHKGICLQRRQFSCWDRRGGAENFHALLDRAQRLLAGEPTSPKLLSCLAAAEGCLAGALIDTLGAATHYYSPASMVPLGRMPAWVVGATWTAERYGHRFYRSVR